MTRADLVPLEHIDAFTPDIRAKLRDYWITSAQEYLDVVGRPNDVHTTGEGALKHVLGLDQAGLDQLYAAAKAAAPSFSYDVIADEEEAPGGCIFSEADLNLPFSFAAGEPPPDTMLGPPGWAAEDQGQRCTCVAFTAAAMYRVLAGTTEDLSEQFLFWAGKQLDPNPDDPRGIAPEFIFTALKQQGICAEECWSYNPNKAFKQPAPGSTQLRPIEDMAQGPAPAVALADAPRRRIVGFVHLQPRDMSAIREAVYQGRAVLIGMPFHRYWTDSYQGGRLGRIRPPLPGEALASGHAMCVVGFRADPDAPDGGYFIVRNSWGTRCGAENEDGIGYCHIPYRVISEYNGAAYYITALAQDAQPIIGSQTVADTTGPVIGDSGQGGLAEARALLSRIEADVARLSAMLAQIQEAQP